MNYQQTVNWLFNQLPMYQKQGKSAYKSDLSNTIRLSNYLNNPEHKFKSVHVGGTNGKGSCSHILASIFYEAGYKVGLYTSPHLKDYRERIKINGKKISENFVVDFVKQHKVFFEDNALSFFEMTVGLAFEYFATKKVDIAIIEVGLGGRLDSTNIITPELSIITNIGLDHTQFLGNTLPDIAKEKAGIIKPDVPVVIGETNPETKTVFINKAKATTSNIYFADKLVDNVYDCDLKGNYQQHNIKTVLQSISVLKNSNWKLSDEHCRIGLQNVVKNTKLLGRWQILNKEPKIICDTAHNKEGLVEVMQQLKNEDYQKLHVVFGVVNDKNVSEIITLLPKEAIYYLAKPNIIRGLETEILASYFEKSGFQFNTYSSVLEAFKNAKKASNKNDVIYVGGSTFVVAEII